MSPGEMGRQGSGCSMKEREWGLREKKTRVENSKKKLEWRMQS
jgi:hypothetical protein